jgi:hypothetical protein
MPSKSAQLMHAIAEMRDPRGSPSDSRTHLLLVEADPSARAHHTSALRTAGYEVAATGGLPSAEQVGEADVIIADEAAFVWLQSQPTDVEPTFIVLTDDVRAGVTACLSGAADWTLVGGDVGYLLAVVEEVCRGPH